MTTLCIACTNPFNYGGVSVEQVVPGNGPPGESVTVAILGSFHVGLVTNLDNAQTELGPVTATIGGQPVANATLVSEGRLEGTVSPALALGAHDVTVTLPDGRSGTLPGGYIVGDAPADAGVSDAGSACTVNCTEMIADDPFGDGTSFTYIAGFQGKVYFGPSADGTFAVRTMPDGSGAETVTFTFLGDTTGSTHQNTAGPPYTSIGASGCAANTLACGPDNEDGRGLMLAGVVDGVESLIIGGGRTGGDLDYVYLASDPTPPLSFRYVDLQPALGPQTRGFSALHAFNDQLYLGFPDTGGMQPYLVRLHTAPPAPGLDGVDGTDFLNLHATRLAGFDTGGTSMIDAMTEFNERIYIANSAAWARARVITPVDSPADWLVVTPTDPAYAAKTSVTTNKVVDLEPTDRAVPQMAVFGGRIYVGRNTTDGPQLWMCDPTASGAPMFCNDMDWTLIADNTSGDSQLSQFNNPANTAVTMVTATPTHLFVGFDNAASGVVVFRSNTATPTTAADFDGQAGCSADLHPASCAGLGGNGLGDATNTRIFFATALDFGADSAAYVSTGSGASGVRVYRLR